LRHEHALFGDTRGATRAQLLNLGLSVDAIESRLRRGSLHRLHEGVYAVGHGDVSLRGRWLAAVLAAGPGAVLSHRAAAALWGLRPYDGIEVTAPHRRASRLGSIVHRSSLLPADERTVVDGIPVTTVPRTLFDLAAVLPRRQAERAVEEAEVQGLTDELSLPDLVARYPGRRGARTIRRLLERGNIGLHVTRSELERRFLELIMAVGLPPPALNALAEGFECDVVWREQRVIAELDGRSTHDTGTAFERDRRRDRVLAAAGWRVIRVTWR
jgi:hypothetical protein